MRLSHSYDSLSLLSGNSKHKKFSDQCDRRKKLQIKLFSSKGPSPDKKSNLSVTQLLSQLKPIVPSREAETCPRYVPEEAKKSFVNKTLTSLCERESVSIFLRLLLNMDLSLQVSHLFWAHMSF